MGNLRRRTGQLLAEGTGSLEEYLAAIDRLGPDNKWYDSDHVLDEVPRPEVETPGVPPALAEALEEWLGPMTPAEEIADFIGWTVEKVSEYRK